MYVCMVRYLMFLITAIVIKRSYMLCSLRSTCVCNVPIVRLRTQGAGGLRAGIPVVVRRPVSLVVTKNQTPHSLTKIISWLFKTNNLILFLLKNSFFSLLNRAGVNLVHNSYILRVYSVRFCESFIQMNELFISFNLVLYNYPFVSSPVINFYWNAYYSFAIQTICFAILLVHSRIVSVHVTYKYLIFILSLWLP